MLLGEQSDCGDAGSKVLFSAAWAMEGEQLEFADVRSGHGFQLLMENLFGGRPWTRIG